jgi:hypothetical protein
VCRNALIDEGGCLCVVDWDTLMRAPSELRRSVFKDGQVIDAVLYARVRHEPLRVIATRDEESTDTRTP